MIDQPFAFFDDATPGCCLFICLKSAGQGRICVCGVRDDMLIPAIFVFAAGQDYPVRDYLFRSKRLEICCGWF